MQRERAVLAWSIGLLARESTKMPDFYDFTGIPRPKKTAEELWAAAEAWDRLVNQGKEDG